MFNIPSQLTIQGITIQTFGIFVLLGFLIFSFVVWSEGKKDGFDEEKLFDLLLLTIVSTILFSRALFAAQTSTSAQDFAGRIYRVWEGGYDFIGALIGFLIPVLVFCRSWRWSLYRILDIFSLGFSLGFSIIVLGYVGLQGKFEFLFAFSAWIFLYALISRFRNSKIRSGYGFSIFLAVTALLGLVFFKEEQHLIFYLLLVTLSTAVFVFRWRIANYDKEIIAKFARRFEIATRGKKD